MKIRDKRKSYLVVGVSCWIVAFLLLFTAIAFSESLDMSGKYKLQINPDEKHFLTIRKTDYQTYNIYTKAEEPKHIGIAFITRVDEVDVFNIQVLYNVAPSGRIQKIITMGFTWIGNDFAAISYTEINFHGGKQINVVSMPEDVVLTKFGKESKDHV